MRGSSMPGGVSSDRRLASHKNIDQLRKHVNGLCL
jgi:hypothetical protein